MLAKLINTLYLRLALNILLGVICIVLLWAILDRAFISQTQLSIEPNPIRPLANTTRLNWYATERQEIVEEVIEDSGEELSDANLRAELLGVIQHENSDFSFAAIQTPQVPDGLYAVGDEIANNVALVRIESTRVVVSENGIERQIRLNPLGEAISGEQELIQSVPDNSSQGFSLAGVFGATPITVNGHGLAIRVDDLDAEFALISGLQTGDVLLDINERSITQYMSNPLLLQQVLQETQVDVIVQRSGENLELSLNARSLGERILPNLGQTLLQ